MTNWIDIAEYASKYKVSQSTLRRRIRNESIVFKMERGKYYLEDSSATLGNAPLFSRHKLQQSSAVNHNVVIQAPAVKNTPSISFAKNNVVRATHVTKSNVFDPVETFLDTEALPVFLKNDYENLLIENKRLKQIAAEQETLIKALEAELSSSS